MERRHRLVLRYTAWGLFAAVITLGVVGVWTDDPRWWFTGAFLMLAMLAVAGAAHEPRARPDTTPTRRRLDGQ